MYERWLQGGPADGVRVADVGDLPETLTITVGEGTSVTYVLVEASWQDGSGVAYYNPSESAEAVA